MRGSPATAGVSSWNAKCSAFFPSYILPHNTYFTTFPLKKYFISIHQLTVTIKLKP
jgi:hypothetical protein